MIFTSSLIKIWPKPNDATNKWFPTIESLRSFSQSEGERIRATAVDYFTSVDEALATGDWTSSNMALSKIAKYQHEFGAAVYPSENRIKAEVFYNEEKIFERLYTLYLLMGLIFLILSFTKIIKLFISNCAIVSFTTNVI